MGFKILDNSLEIDVFYETGDIHFDDNLCLRFTEECSEDERLFLAEDTHIYLTIQEAEKFQHALENAIVQAKACHQNNSQKE